MKKVTNKLWNFLLLKTFFLDFYLVITVFFVFFLVIKLSIDLM